MRWTLWTFFSPSQLLVLCVVAGALALVAGRLRLGRALCLAGAAGFVLFGLLPSARVLGDALQRRFPATVLPAQVTGIVLLAGAERGHATERYGEPQLNEAGSRYVTALRLAVRYPQARLVFVGGSNRNPRTGELDQTGVARRLLGSVGLDPRRLAFEDTSTDTCDSALNARTLVQPRPGERWILVTSALHMPRAMGCFRAAGWELIPRSADYQGAVHPWSPPAFRVIDNLQLFDAAMHEWIGLAYYRISGRTSTLFPAP